MNDDQLQRTIAQLRADYAAQLPGAVAQMETQWRQVLAAEIPPAHLADLVRRAHSMCGSGTTFGFPAVSAAACELESVLERVAKSGQLPGPKEQETVAQLLAALRQALSRS